MKAIVTKKSDPYNGPYENNIVKYDLMTEDEQEIVWYEKLSDPRTKLKADRGHIVEGLVLEKRDNRMIPHYKNSKIRVINRQFNLTL